MQEGSALFTFPVSRSIVGSLHLTSSAHFTDYVALSMKSSQPSQHTLLLAVDGCGLVVRGLVVRGVVWYYYTCPVLGCEGVWPGCCLIITQSSP